MAITTKNTTNFWDALSQGIDSGFTNAGNAIAGVKKDPNQTASEKPQVTAPPVVQPITPMLSNAPMPAPAQRPFSPIMAPPVPPVPVPQMQFPAPQLTMPPPPVPLDQMQLTMPTVQPQYQLGQPMYYSDQNLKTNISNTSQADINELIKSIAQPKNYDYKDSANGTHTKGGLMAQDLEKSNIGKSAVIETPKGKAIDVGKLVTILASTHSHKIAELENKFETILNEKFKKKK